MIEGITFREALAFAQSWGAVYFMIMFAVVVVYALWPANRTKFKRAAEIPFHAENSEP